MTDQNVSGEVVAIGIGSAGSRIVSLLSKESLLVDRFAYVSCDKNDFPPARPGDTILVDCPVDQKLTPSIVRGLAARYHDEITRLLVGSRVVFVVAGLGGATGTALAPYIAEVAQEIGSITIGIAVMPFEYEKKLKFYAGIALRRLRSAARGVIVIDNDVLMKASPEDSLTDVYEAANREAGKALSSILSRSSDSAVSVGLNKLLVTISQDGYSLLGMSSSDSSDKAEEALAGAVITLNRTAEVRGANHAVVILTGNSTVSAAEVGLAVKRLGYLIDNQDVDVEYSVNYGGSSQLQVSLLASGFKSTKYDEYDPLAKIFKGNIIDDEMDSAIPYGLEKLQPCEF